MTETLTQVEAARRIGITPRMLQKHGKGDSPPPRDPQTKRYLWPELRTWYQAMKTGEGLRRLGVRGSGGSRLTDARARKVNVDAELKEYELAERRGDLVPRGNVLAMVRAPLEAVDRELREAPRRFAPAWATRLGVSEAEAIELIEGLVEEVRRRLRELGDAAA